jgi:hypothetical protein
MLGAIPEPAIDAVHAYASLQNAERRISSHAYRQWMYSQACHISIQLWY